MIEVMFIFFYSWIDTQSNLTKTATNNITQMVTQVLSVLVQVLSVCNDVSNWILLRAFKNFSDEQGGICALARKMTSLRQSENIITLSG